MQIDKDHTSHIFEGHIVNIRTKGCNTLSLNMQNPIVQDTLCTLFEINNMGIYLSTMMAITVWTSCIEIYRPPCKNICTLSLYLLIWAMQYTITFMDTLPLCHCTINMHMDTMHMCHCTMLVHLCSIHNCMHVMHTHRHKPMLVNNIKVMKIT